MTEEQVDEYQERPYEDAQASQADIDKVENRPETDQIADYHEKNPTLADSPDTTQPEAEQPDDHPDDPRF